MKTKTTLAAVAVASAAIATPAALAITSHVKLFQNQEGTVSCGLEIAIHGKPNTVLCSAMGIPKPKGTPKTAAGDPFVQITKKGKPKLVLISQDSFVTNSPTLLGDGTTWSSVGVTCKLGHTVKCTNGSGHGFKIGNGKYKPF